MNNVNNYLTHVSDPLTKKALTPLLTGLATRLSSQIFNTGGLVIKAGGGVLAKTVNTVISVCNGIYVSLAAADMPALTGLVITAAKFNVAVFLVDSAGTTSVLFGQEGATAALVKFPELPSGKASIGFLMITHSSTFTGGTTALDTATTVYVNTVGPFDATATV